MPSPRSSSSYKKLKAHEINLLQYALKSLQENSPTPHKQLKDIFRILSLETDFRSFEHNKLQDFFKVLGNKYEEVYEIFEKADETKH